jgi:predicted nuclease of predicted toxin-antitoxin system
MSLRFELDENLPRRLELALRDLGHDVETAASEGLCGSAETAVLDACQAEDRVLITLDIDFSDIRLYPPASHRGIWVLRPAEQTFDAVLGLALGGVELARVESAAGRLWVIDQKRVQIRG